MKHQHETLGMWLGVLGVAIFAVTLPMTRLATGTADAPQLSPWFVTFGRAALARALSLIFLGLTPLTLARINAAQSAGHGLNGNALGYRCCWGLRCVMSPLGTPR